MNIKVVLDGIIDRVNKTDRTFVWSLPVFHRKRNGEIFKYFNYTQFKDLSVPLRFNRDDDTRYTSHYHFNVFEEF